jgi:hypothetical protein
LDRAVRRRRAETRSMRGVLKHRAAMGNPQTRAPAATGHVATRWP